MIVRALLFCVLIGFGLLPILPFKLKGIIIISLLLLGIISLRNKKRDNWNWPILLNTTLFILYLISATYSANSNEILNKLETTTSLFIVPIAFLCLSTNGSMSKKILRHEGLFKKTFIASSTLLAILIFIKSFDYGDYINKKININQLSLNLDKGFYWLEDHPIYLSIYLSISMLLILTIIRDSTARAKLLLILSFLVQLFILFLMSKKGVIVAFIISFVGFLLSNKAVKRRNLLLVFAGLVLSIFIAAQFMPDTLKRFKEVFDSKSYAKVESYSSTSIRYAVYNCSIKVIKASPFYGYGLGDVKEELNGCYEKTSSVLTEKNLNTHNQFLGISVATGIIGLIVFLSSLFFIFYMFKKNNDLEALVIMSFLLLIMMTENILDRQNGVICFAFFLNYYFFRNSIKLN
ncbi:MAG: O-antigen ligase family protein [Bacteroidia bacterium]|nr:O-antigen ligase family protein [Bacteroidia bacterium]